MLQYRAGFLITPFGLLVAMDSYYVVAGVIASSSSESPSVGIA